MCGLFSWCEREGDGGSTKGVKIYKSHVKSHEMPADDDSSENKASCLPPPTSATAPSSTTTTPLLPITRRCASSAWATCPVARPTWRSSRT